MWKTRWCNSVIPWPHLKNVKNVFCIIISCCNPGSCNSSSFNSLIWFVVTTGINFFLSLLWIRCMFVSLSLVFFCHGEYSGVFPTAGSFSIMNCTLHAACVCFHTLPKSCPSETRGISTHRRLFFISVHRPAVSVHAEAQQQPSDDTSVYYRVIYAMWFYGRLETFSTSYGSYLYTCVMYRDRVEWLTDAHMDQDCVW